MRVSTPSRHIWRDTRRNSSGPSQMISNDCRSCMWLSRMSPRPPETVISGVAASIRGPGISPASIAFRITMSSRGLADAAQQRLVKPWSSRSFAWRMVSRVCSSGGRVPIPSRLVVFVNDGWAWASTRPGIRVAPPPSITSAPSWSTLAATSLMRLP